MFEFGKKKMNRSRIVLKEFGGRIIDTGGIVVFERTLDEKTNLMVTRLNSYNLGR